jgi:hypothetical protein
MTAVTRQRLLTLRSGGWVIVVSAIVCAALTAWAIIPAVFRFAERGPGDGQRVESYGFDLTTCLVPREHVVPGYLHRDLVESIVNPQHLRGAEMDAHNEAIRGNYVLPEDRVLGVVIGGEARAYPVSVLNCHEIVNDTLGGTPVAVTYNPLCDSAAVFDRRVNGRTLEFGVSGLLYQSNLVMYDRAAGPDDVESLWSQLQARAIAGPAAAAGATLRSLPVDVTTWADWLRRHPQTTVIHREAEMVRRYKETNYAGYFRAAKLMFPVNGSVTPPPLLEGRAPKSRVVMVGGHNDRRVYPIDARPRRANETVIIDDVIAGVPVKIEVSGALELPHVVVTTSGPDADDLEVMHSFWFAWHALRLERPVEP